jgi:hypothetical protein
MHALYSLLHVKPVLSQRGLALVTFNGATGGGGLLLLVGLVAIVTGESGHVGLLRDVSVTFHAGVL